MSRARTQVPSLLAVPALTLLALGASPGTSPPDAGVVTPADGVVLVDYRKVHEETGAGADSGISPDGRWLSFSSGKSGNREVYAVDTETGEVRNLTNTPEDDWEARWHPDGTHIVFTARRGGQNGVFVMDLETGEETTVMSTKEGYEDYPSFSKDGTKVSFTAGPFGTREVYTWDWATGEVRNLTRGHNYVGSTNFSADGTEIVYHAYYGGSYNSERADIFVVDAEGGRGRNITNNDDVWVYKAQWSPDGAWIAFSARYDTPNFNLWVMRPDGSERTKITDQAGEDFRWADWTADGRLAWHGIRSQEGALYGAGPDGARKRIAFGADFVRHLSVTPDGTKLVYELGGDIFVAEARADAVPLLLTEGTRPWVSDDGATVHFLRNRGRTAGTIAIGGGEVALVEDADTDGWPELGVESVRSGDGRHTFEVENRPQVVSYYITNESVSERLARETDGAGPP